MVFFSIILLLLDSRHYLSKSVSYTLQAVVSPLQDIANFPSRVFYRTRDALRSHDNLLKENQALKTEVILLKLEQQRFLNLENENKELRELLQAAQALPIKTSVAEVLFVRANPYPGEWIINKGKHDGVNSGQAVLNAEGIVGQVIMVGPNRSRVMLISDTRSSIPVESVQTGLRSILQGEGDGLPLSLRFIPKTEKVMVGDILTSSGIEHVFPKGYPVGKVIEVDNYPEDQFLSIKVEPLAELSHDRFVLLVGELDA